jgi:cation diffusion facilitator family transporter
MMTQTSQGNGAVVRRVTLVGMAVNLALAGIKFALGLVGHSQALVADAVHSLSDLGTDLILLLGVRYWTAPADESHPYGHHRIETMVSAVIGLFLLGAAGGIGFQALTSLREADAEAPGWIAFAGALISIVFKEVLFRWTRAAGLRIGSPALAANAWHQRTDSLSSVPVAMAVVVAIVFPDWSFVDRIAALVVTGFLLHAAWGILRDAFGELTDRSAPSEARLRLLELSRSVDGVCDVHALRTRLSGGGTHVDLHVLVEGTLTVQQGHDIASAVRRRLLDQGPRVIDVVVHIEPFEEEQLSP